MRILVISVIACTVLFAGAGSPQSFYDQAVALEKGGDTIRAADMAREALRMNGDHVPSLALLAKLTAQSLQLSLAHDLIVRALKLDRENVGVNLLCARIEYQLKNGAMLEECLNRVEKKHPLGADTEAIRAQLLIDNAQYAVARRKIDLILRNNPGHAETHLRLAELYLKLRQFEKAEAQFRKMQNLFPQDAELAVQMARARVNGFLAMTAAAPADGDDAASRALSALRHAYANNPENLAVTHMLAQLLSVTDKCGEAMEYLQKLKSARSESRSIVVFFALCEPGGNEAQKLLADYLRRNEDDDLVRHQAELAQLLQNKKREAAQATKAARYHRKNALREMERNADSFALSELRWSEFLFPGYTEAHRDLMNYFRAQRDFERLADELVFMRDATGSRDYRELVERLENEKRDLWYVKAGVQNPERAKNPMPIHVYPLKARDPLVDHPLGGVAIADRARVHLQNFGRVRSISREMAALAEAQKFSAENLRKLRQTYDEALSREENPFSYTRRPLSLALSGSFSEIPHGIEVWAELIDAPSGIRASEIRFKSTGRDYLNKAAVRLAEFIFEKSPVSMNILKIADDDRVLINAGKRDGLKKNSEFTVIDKAGRQIVFKAMRRDFDIIEAKSELADATKHLKAGDAVLFRAAEVKPVN